MLREEEMLVQARLRHVCVDSATWSKAEIPDWIRSGLERFAGDTHP